MKRYTTSVFKALAMSYMLFPVIYLPVSAVLFDIPLKKFPAILLGPSFFSACFFAVITGWALWEMKRWAWHIFLFANLVILYLNATVVFVYGETHHQALSFVFSIFLLGMIIHRVKLEVRVPYFLPNIPWWESSTRYHLKVPVKVFPREGTSVEGDILDLSNGGCFIKLSHTIRQDEEISVKFKIFEYEMDCDAVIVWRTESTVTHPKGIGAKFIRLDRNQKKVMKLVSKSFKEVQATARRGEPTEVIKVNNDETSS